MPKYAITHITIVDDENCDAAEMALMAAMDNLQGGTIGSSDIVETREVEEEE